MSATAWSKSLPAEVGAYWFKPSEDGNAELLFVRMVLFHGTGVYKLAVDAITGAKPVEQLGGFWAGPLLPPIENEVVRRHVTLEGLFRSIVGPNDSPLRLCSLLAGCIDQHFDLPPRCTTPPS